MTSKRKVSQDDLRKMMEKIKGSSDKTTSKKLKLSSRELALLEEEKRQKALRDQEKIRLKQEKMARIVPNQALQPKKSILKNSGSVQPSFSVPKYQGRSVEEARAGSATDPLPKDAFASLGKKNELPKDFYDTPKDKMSRGKVEKTEAESSESNEIPEGFFDDPKLDAKARKVQYVDHEEEEWKKFQSEIASEVITAQEILVEDRNEATAGRQLEEIEEQMEAWKRVAQLEQKKDVAHQTMISKSGIVTAEDLSDSESSDIELDQLTDWRKKS